MSNDEAEEEFTWLRFTCPVCGYSSKEREPESAVVHLLEHKPEELISYLETHGIANARSLNVNEIFRKVREDVVTEKLPRTIWTKERKEEVERKAVNVGIEKNSVPFPVKDMVLGIQDEDIRNEMVLFVNNTFTLLSVTVLRYIQSYNTIKSNKFLPAIRSAKKEVLDRINKKTDDFVKLVEKKRASNPP